MFHTAWARSAGIGAIVVIVAGCGVSRSASGGPGKPKGNSARRLRVIGPNPRIQELAGLPEAEAEARAKSWGFRVRILHPDELKSLSLERVLDRLNLVVKDGKVTRTWQG